MIQPCNSIIFKLLSQLKQQRGSTRGVRHTVHILFVTLVLWLLLELCTVGHLPTLEICCSPLPPVCLWGILMSIWLFFNPGFSLLYCHFITCIHHSYIVSVFYICLLSFLFEAIRSRKVPYKWMLLCKLCKSTMYKASEGENVTWVAVWIGQGVSTQLSRMVGWMEKLLLGGQQVGRVVQTVQRVEEVYLMKEGGELCLQFLYFFPHITTQPLMKGYLTI